MKDIKTFTKNDVNFLFEIGTLRQVNRGWDYLVNTKLQNVAEHNFRVLWVAYIVWSYYPKLSLEKVLKTALSYNLCRSRVSDPHYLALLNTVIDKNKAVADMLENTSIKKEYESIIKQYFDKDCPEAIIVYTANSIENILELKELAAEGLEVAKIWLDLNFKTFYSQIKLDIGKKLFNVVKNTEPYIWHLSIQDFFKFNKPKNIKNRQKREVCFLYEIGTVKLLERSWSQFISGKSANVAEHTFRTMWVSVLLANKLKDVNIEKVLLMSLIHDIDEIRSFDSNYINTQYVKINKESSAKGTFEWLHDKTKLTKLYLEYKKQNCPESKLVKDADSIEAVLEIKEKVELGVSVASNWLILNKKRLSGKLNYKVSNELLELVLRGNSNMWHLTADNRFFHKW